MMSRRVFNFATRKSKKAVKVTDSKNLSKEEKESQKGDYQRLWIYID